REQSPRPGPRARLDRLLQQSLSARTQLDLEGALEGVRRSTDLQRARHRVAGSRRLDQDRGQVTLEAGPREVLAVRADLDGVNRGELGQRVHELRYRRFGELLRLECRETVPDRQIRLEVVRNRRLQARG